MAASERKIDTPINSSLDSSASASPLISGGIQEFGPRRRGARSREFAAKVTLWQQFRALFLKDLTLQSRAIRTNLCQLLTPIVCILLVGIMQLIPNHILGSTHFVTPGLSDYLFPQDIGRVAVCDPEPLFNGTPVPPASCHDEIFSFFDNQDLSVNIFNELLVEFIFFLLFEINETLFNEIERGLKYYQNASVLPRQQVLFDLPFYFVGISHEANANQTLGGLGSLSFDGSKTGFLVASTVGGMVADKWYYNFSTNFVINPDWTDRHFQDNYTDDGPHISVPFFLEIESREALNKHLLEVIENYNTLAHFVTPAFDQYDQYEKMHVITPLSQRQYKAVLEDVQNATATENKTETETYLRKIRPHGAIFIDQFTSSESRDSTQLEYTMVAQDLALYGFHDHFLFINERYTHVHRRNNIVNMMSNALFKHLAENASEPVPIATYIMPLPSASKETVIDLRSLLARVLYPFDLNTLLTGGLYPFAASFLLPVFISSVVKDKHEKHLIMMVQSGLSRWTYWFVTYIFHFLLYCVVFLVIAVLSLAFQIRLFAQTNGLVLTVAFIVWGHALVVLGFFFSNFFNRTRTATFIGYLLVIAGVIFAILLEFLEILPDDKTPFPIYMMYPPFAFYRIITYMTNACTSLRCFGIDDLSPADGLNMFTTALLYIGGSTVALIFISIYLSYVLPSEYGVRKSPFFPLIAVLKPLRLFGSKIGCCGQPAGRIQSHELSLALPDVNVEVEDMDEDVQAEEDTLREGLPDDVPVVMYQLRKEYPGSFGQPPHVAVHSISLAIQRNECFGLLGPNGAGKSTLISVLTGLHEPTSGTAKIAGYDISTDIHAIRHHLGVCPQFDIQHANLTAEEHLLFYARLKGVKRNSEKEVVTRALQQVNLYDARKRKSKALSGGMRRRLSVAMACIANPDILILDEPTTGLDPASRRQVWEVIETVKQERAVILTTPAMEEADHLCTRIGIMNFGRLRCLGTQTRLQACFGTGYQLKFQCAFGKVEELESFLRMHLPQATHLETFADSCTYKLAKEGLVVSELFQLLDSMRDQLGILDWGLKMTTLEDVFSNIVRRNRDPRLPSLHSRCPSRFPCPCYPRGEGGGGREEEGGGGNSEA